MFYGNTVPGFHDNNFACLSSNNVAYFHGNNVECFLGKIIILHVFLDKNSVYFYG